MNLTVFPGYDVALKTGTSNDYRDAWSMGYTPDLVVGVWAGNNDNTPMQKNGSSILAAVPMWHAFMAQAITQISALIHSRRPRRPLPTKPILAGDYAGKQPDPHDPLLRRQKRSNRSRSQQIPPPIRNSITGKPASSIGQSKTSRISQRNITSNEHPQPELRKILAMCSRIRC